MENAVKRMILIVPWMTMMIVRPVLNQRHPWKNNPPEFEVWVGRATPALIKLGVLMSIGFFMIVYHGTLVLMER